MWVIKEHRDIKNVCRKLPGHVIKKYELWKNIVYRHGSDKLREFPGFNDESLKGNRKGERSSRLSLKHRVIYSVKHKILTIIVLEIIPHKY